MRGYRTIPQATKYTKWRSAAKTKPFCARRGANPSTSFKIKSSTKPPKCAPVRLRRFSTCISPCGRRRRVNNDQTIAYEGQNYPIAETAKKYVSILYHPKRIFWVLEEKPKNV